MSTNIIAPTGALTTMRSFPSAVHPSPSADEAHVEIKAQITHRLADLQEALPQAGNLITVTEASFAVLRICAAFATTTRNDALIEEMDFEADLLNQGPEAGDGLDCTAKDFVRTVTPMIEHTAALTDHEALITALPTIRLAFWQSAQQFIKRDPDLNPFRLSDLGWDLVRAFEAGGATSCDNLIRILATEILTSTSLTAPPVAAQETDLRIGYDPFAQDWDRVAEAPAGSSAASSSPAVIDANFPSSASLVEAKLARLLPRQTMLTELLQQQSSVQLRVEHARINQRIQSLRSELEWIRDRNAEIMGEPEITTF